MSKKTESGPGGTSQNDDDDYDPHLHRELEKPNTSLETTFHLIKGSFGTGVLAMPEGFLFAGMINAIILTIILAAFNCYCIHLLIRSQYVFCKRLKVGLLKYPESVEVGFDCGPQIFRKCKVAGREIVYWTFVVYQTGVCCVYVVFVTVNVRKVFDYYLDKEVSLYIYFAILFVPFCCIALLRDLKILAPFNLVANIISLVTFGVIIYYSCFDLPPFSDRPAFGDFTKVPLFFGTVAFAITGLPVLISAENNMARPQDFLKTCGVLDFSILFCTAIYVVVSMMGYWKYGEDVKPSITLNFPVEEILTRVVLLLYSVAIYISFSVNIFVPIKMIWDKYWDEKLKDSTKKKRLLVEYLIRLLLVIMVFILSACVPFLGYLISILGAVCLSLIGIVFPAALDLCALWPDNWGIFKYVVVRDSLIMLLGLFIAIAGMYTSIAGMVEEYQK